MHLNMAVYSLTCTRKSKKKKKALHKNIQSSFIHNGKNYQEPYVSWIKKLIKIFFYSGILFSKKRGMELIEAFNNMDEPPNILIYLLHDSICIKF